MSLARFFPRPQTALGGNGGGNGPTPEEIRAVVKRELGTLVATGNVSVPRAPEVALEVLRLSCRSTVSSSQIARPLQRDPFLTGRLLKLANSAAMAPRGRTIVSIHEAVTRVGILAVRNLLLSAAMKQTVFRGPHRKLLRALWVQSLGTAVASELIARQLRRPSELAFAVGILHDIGRPLLVSCIDKLTCDEGVTMDFETVWEVVDGDLSRAASALLFTAWDLPEELRVALEERSPEGEAQLRLASWIASSDRHDLRMMARISEPLELNDDDATKILTRYPKVLDQLR